MRLSLEVFVCIENENCSMSNIVRAWGLTLVVCGIMQVCMWFLF